MKQRFAALLITGLFIFLSIGSPARALEFQGGEIIRLDQGKETDGSYYAAGKRIIIDGTVNGDVLCAAQNIRITGIVTGDVLCAGQTIVVSGQVGGDIRMVGQNITLTNSVGGNATIAGQNIDIESAASIQNETVIVGQDILSAGTYGNSIYHAGETVSVDGVVDGNVDIEANTVIVGPDAEINGNINYRSEDDALISSSALVSGTSNKLPVRESVQEKQKEKEARAAQKASVFSPFNIIMAFGHVLVGVVLLLVARSGVEQTAKEMLTHPWKVLGLGVVFLLLTPIVVLLLFVTIIGIPLGFIMLTVWFIGLFMAWSIGAYSFSLAAAQRFLRKYTNRPYYIMVAGVLFVSLLYIIPFIGWLLMMGIMMWGMGGTLLLLQHGFRSIKKSQKE